MTSADLEVDFWNVGQGDCSVIKLSSGRLIIIDVGPRGSPLIEWLREGYRRSVEIEAVILTHNDSDHTGSLPSLIHEFKHRIKAVWMLLDRPKTDSVFQKTFRAALEGESEGHFKIGRLESGQLLWTDAERKYHLKVVHPSFSQSILAQGANDTSGVIVLEHLGQNLITWAGDLQLRSTASVLTNYAPQSMVGPHHGGPSDYPTKAMRRKTISEGIQDRMLQIRTAAASLAPEFNFISVGTKNSYNHPRPGYLRLMTEHGVKVACSQLTACCDRKRTLNGHHVFQGDGALGLRAPKSGVSCRGAHRTYIKDGKLQEDEFTAIHSERLSNLYRPQCLRRASRNLISPDKTR